MADSPYNPWMGRWRPQNWRQTPTGDGGTDPKSPGTNQQGQGGLPSPGAEGKTAPGTNVPMHLVRPVGGRESIYDRLPPPGQEIPLPIPAAGEQQTWKYFLPGQEGIDVSSSFFEGGQQFGPGAYRVEGEGGFTENEQGYLSEAREFFNPLTGEWEVNPAFDTSGVNMDAMYPFQVIDEDFLAAMGQQFARLGITDADSIAVALQESGLLADVAGMYNMNADDVLDWQDVELAQQSFGTDFTPPQEGDQLDLGGEQQPGMTPEEITQLINDGISAGMAGPMQNLQDQFSALQQEMSQKDQTLAVLTQLAMGNQRDDEDERYNPVGYAPVY